jgi:hypothetical protein
MARFSTRRPGLHLQMLGANSILDRTTPIPMPQSQTPALSGNTSTQRTPNRLVKDRIAETVKSIRHLYDVKKRKARSKPGSLL